MGLDGGTIPSRADILRRSSWRLANADNSRSTRGGNIDNVSNGEPGQATKQEQGRIKWSVCALSGESLSNEIVACELGKIYNKLSVVEFLLGEGVFAQKKEDLKKNGFGHIKSLKSVFELQLQKNPELEKQKAPLRSDETTSYSSGLFICPITQIEANGHHPFSALKTCGHVFSEKALNQMEGDVKTCWLCNHPFEKNNIIALNSTDPAVVANLEKRLEEKEKGEHKEKKEKKEKGKGKEKEKEKEKEKKRKDLEATETEKESKGKEKDLKGKQKQSSSAVTTTTATTTTSTSTSTTTSSQSTTTPVAKKIKV